MTVSGEIVASDIFEMKLWRRRTKIFEQEAPSAKVKSEHRHFNYVTTRAKL